MHILKLFCLTLFQFIKAALLLPRSVVNAIRQRRRQIAQDASDAERLDRIRNPSKYLGR